MFTSGTTGPSKGVVRSHVADFTLARTTIEIMGYGPGEVLYSAFPLYHLNAKFNSVLAAMLVGGRLVLHDRFSASGFWDICRAEGATAFNFMGALLTMLLKQPPRHDDGDNPVRAAYGAPAPEPLVGPFEARFGVRLVEVYGSTELGIATHNTVRDRRVGTSGRAAAYVEVEIHDAGDRPLAPGVAGEICVRPRRPHVIFDRYHDMPVETLAAFRNLWFHSGDRGWLDDDGCLHFVDRLADAVRRRGENISSFEVEKVVLAHDAVAACAVVGTPDEVSGEEVALYVICTPGHDVSPEALLDHCQEHLPHFAVPRYVAFVDTLPLTPSQRVEKYRLRAQGLLADVWDREAHGYKVRR
jgi:crotonobetaine/carnitine-CoA ligase